jgi:hypothetical protein
MLLDGVFGTAACLIGFPVDVDVAADVGVAAEVEGVRVGLLMSTAFLCATSDLALKRGDRTGDMETSLMDAEWAR